MPNSGTELFPPVTRSMNCRGRLIPLDKPLVMGILNLTPDSFSDGGEYNSPDAALARVEQMLAEGAAIIDIGGYSSRPGATDISPAEEIQRIREITLSILRKFPEALISIDTFRAEVAREMLEAGVHIINDISGGMADPQMFETVAGYDAPYVLMHMKGTPQTMQQNPVYENIAEEMHGYFVRQIDGARTAGIRDILLDPGFGFGKTLAHNYEVYRNLGNMSIFGLPVLIGISRKSMIYKLFETHPTDVLELSTALHFKALDAGVKILRVHDVRPAVRAVQLHNYLTHGTL